MIRTLLILICASPFQLFAQVDQLKDFPIWQTGRDPETIQLIPISGDDPLVIEAGKKVVHVKFQVKQYGEVSFPIDGVSPRGTEAQRIDLSSKKCIKIRYRANHEFVLQLRQTGIHGGVHNHVTLATTKDFETVTIPFTTFKGGKTPLDLRDVAKFNFAFLSNNKDTGFAELEISAIAFE